MFNNLRGILMRRTIINSALTLGAFTVTFGVGVVLVRGSSGDTSELSRLAAPSTSTAPSSDGLGIYDTDNTGPVPRDLSPEELAEEPPTDTPDEATGEIVTIPVAPSIPGLPVVVPRPPADPTATFPTTNPLRVEGMTDTYYLAANDAQASIYGLPPGSVRTWGIGLTASANPDDDHQRILAGLKASGFIVINDEMAGNTDGTTGRITGDYKSWTFTFIVLNRQSASISLLDW
jgi:hypothetical protein